MVSSSGFSGLKAAGKGKIALATKGFQVVDLMPRSGEFISCSYPIIDGAHTAVYRAGTDKGDIALPMRQPGR